MMQRLMNRLRRFRRDDEGSILAETVIMFPTLVAAVLATFVFFDAFRNQAINLKAAYTISDALSRETDYITNTYMINTWRLHRFLTSSPTLTKMRVSVIQYLEEEGDEPGEGDYSVVWSQSRGGVNDMTNSELDDFVTGDQIPVMPSGETLIIVETWVDYQPQFSIGFEGFTFENMIFTRPRFGPKLCYSHNGTHSGRICPLDS